MDLLLALIPTSPALGLRAVAPAAVADDFHHFLLSPAAFRPAAFPLRVGFVDVLVCDGYLVSGDPSFPRPRRATRTFFVPRDEITYVSWRIQLHCVRKILYRSAPHRGTESTLGGTQSPLGDVTSDPGIDRRRDAADSSVFAYLMRYPTVFARLSRN